MGFLTGTSMPGRRSTPVRSIILLQRAVYRSELRIELRADALRAEEKIPSCAFVAED
jgi:hypothetical protein